MDPGRVFDDLRAEHLGIGRRQSDLRVADRRRGCCDWCRFEPTTVQDCGRSGLGIVLRHRVRRPMKGQSEDVDPGQATLSAGPGRLRLRARRRDWNSRHRAILIGQEETVKCINRASLLS